MKAEQALPPAYRRVVIDTNVLLSAALLQNSVPARLLDHILSQGALVFSEETFAELETRIWKPKFDRYLSIERRQQLLHDFNASALWVDVPMEIRQRHSRDSDDDKLIHAAQAAGVMRLISGDDDLLCLHPFHGIDIITPRTACDEIGLP